MSSSSCCSWFGETENEGLRNPWLALGFGQLVSFAFASMTFSASLVSTRVDAPIILSFTQYSAVSVVYGSIVLYRRRKLLVSWYWYLLLGFIDAEGNYLVNKSYQFTSITSVTIMNCWTIVWSILLTWMVLGTKYSPWQFVGAAVCIGGLGLVLVSDSGVGGGGGSNPVLGDFLVIVGSILFTLSNVAQEFCVKRKDMVEVVAMKCVFGMIVSAIQIFLLERSAVATIQWSTGLFLAYVAYGLSGFMFCSLAPFVLKRSGTAFLRLSLLTCSMWAVVIRIFIYKQKVDWLYYLAFSLVVVGIFTFTKTQEDPNNNTRALDNANLDQEHSLLGD